MMNTGAIKDALTVEIEWQDSVMNDGTHRLLGRTANLNVEIIPETSVTLAYAEADHSVLSVVEQITGDQEKALTFLHTAAQYVEEHPNEPYHADYQNGSISLTQILTADHPAANVLHITTQTSSLHIGPKAGQPRTS
jgi:hypothetical protein